MSERLMTCVFACDVRTFEGNPHHAETPFGKPLVVSDGDLAGDYDRMEARADAAETLLADARGLMSDSLRCLKKYPGADAMSVYDQMRAFLAETAPKPVRLGDEVGGE